MGIFKGPRRFPSRSQGVRNNIMTDRQQSTFFCLIVFLFASGAGLLVYKQYDTYFQQKAAIDLEAASVVAPISKSSVPIVLADGRLQVDSPKEGGTVDQTFTVSGYAQGWFEGNIVIKVFDNNNQLLYQGNAIAGDNYGHPAPFSSAITLSATSTTPTGRIEFNDYSAKDGSLVYQKVVNIKFANFVTVKAGWKNFNGHTAYGEQYTFSLQYPETWSLGESRGGPALIYGKCTIVPGAGGHGMEGYPAPKIEFTTVDGLKATIQTWAMTGSDTLVNAQVMNGNDDYIFDLNYPGGQNQCLKDFMDILNTVKINR